MDAPRGPDHLTAALRRTEPPVIGRVVDDRLVMDVRTILPDEEEELIGSLVAALEES